MDELNCTMNKKIRVTESEVLGDDMSTPFWRSILNNPDYPKMEQDIAYIIDQSRKHGKPFRDIQPDKLDPYDWKLK